MKKICKRCLKEKDSSAFGYAPENADKLKGKCKECCNEERRISGYYKTVHKETCRLYEKTKKGFLMRLYRNMQSRITGVQKRKHHLYEGKEILSRGEFYQWALEQNNFHELFDRYEKSGYDRRLAPSVDRIKSNIGYVVGNIEFVTHSENSRRGALTKGVKVIDVETGIIYNKIPDAAKAINMNYHNLRNRLEGVVKNDTTIVYLKDYSK